MVKVDVAAAATFLAISGVAGVKVKSISKDEDVCRCQSNYHVYRTRQATCGDGGEHGEVPGSYCTLINDRFAPWFPMQDHNYCMRINDGPDPVDFWCYVSAQCSDLNGGNTINANVSMKICGEKDSKLGDLMPAELMALSPWEPLLSTLFAYAFNASGPEPNGPCVRVKGPPARMGVVGQDEEMDAIQCNGEKWHVHDGDIECVEGSCGPGTKAGQDIVLAANGDKRPRIEGWMYGEVGPAPCGNKEGDARIRGQDDSNSFPLKDEISPDFRPDEGARYPVCPDVEGPSPAEESAPAEAQVDPESSPAEESAPAEAQVDPESMPATLMPGDEED